MRGRQLSTITNKQTTKTNIQHSHPDGYDIPRIRETCVLENGCRKPESGYYALTILDLLNAQNQHHQFNTQLLPFSPDGSVGEKKYSCGDFLIKIWFSRPNKLSRNWCKSKMNICTVIPALVQRLFFDISKQRNHKYATPPP